MAEVLPAIFRVVDNMVLELRGLRKFMIENRGEVNLYIGTKSNPILPIPPESSRPFENHPPDIFPDVEWQLKFGHESGKKEAYVILWTVEEETTSEPSAKAGKAKTPIERIT